MRSVSLKPKVHLFVCANRRDENNPLGPGCGDAGERVFASLKNEVARFSLFRSVWVTKTYCLGICPKVGTAVASYPSHEIFTEVQPSDASTLFASATSTGTTRQNG